MKPIHTYQSLGRFIIDSLYGKLYSNSGFIEYDKFKKSIEKAVNENPFIDKKFAKYKYKHGKSKTKDSRKYRWETIMDFYIKQQIKASLVAYCNLTATDFTNMQSVKIPHICIGENFLEATEKTTNRYQLFDLARNIIKQKYERQKKTR